MKKIYFLILFIAISIFTMAQPVGRQKVIVEIATGTWCTYCPGAAMGADDLVENGCQVGVVEYHNGDAYTNDASNYRNSYYSVSGFPTAHFDGVLEYVGGDHYNSMYPNYLPLYQQRMAVNSDFTIDIYGEHTGSVYDVQMVINKVNGTWGELTAHIVLTESEIVYSWQDQDHLNFVERLMAPDHLGTTVDFTSENQLVVTVQFTMATDWVAANCEVVGFIQNEATKEILQGNMVPVPNLQVMPAMAFFNCNDVTPCITTSVEFEDESLGDVISWNWAFEGGSPATSTAQNPVVTYNTQGQYDVRLIVYDGTVYDTLLNPEYVLVITPPVQPNTPSGPTSICQDYTGIQYLTRSVQWATTYNWTVEPSNAGTISGPDTVASFTLNPAFLGNYTIKVRADNSCGNGTWSQGLNCAAYMTPSQYTLSEGGGYCDGAGGIELTMDGSQQGINYEIFLDGESTGQIVSGNGGPLNFGYKTEQGIYTCVGFTDHCDQGMVGNTYIYIIYSPTKAAMPGGSTQECNSNFGVTYTTAGATNATSYTWSLSPENAGTITGNTTTATVDWNHEFWGQATINVAGVNSCFTGPISDNLYVTVGDSPDPGINGDDYVCDYEVGLIYNTAEVEGNTYTWEINGGTITSGAGTHEIIVNWTNPGNGYVKVTESNGTCSTTTNNFEVFIDDCTGVEENGTDMFSIFPNPVKNELQVRFDGKPYDCRVVVVNLLGQVIYDKMTGGSGLVLINTSSFSRGVYAMRIYGENGVIERKFVKAE